jgi:hypothetical protein
VRDHHVTNHQAESIEVEPHNLGFRVRLFYNAAGGVHCVNALLDASGSRALAGFLQMPAGPVSSMTLRTSEPGRSAKECLFGNQDR